MQNSVYDESNARNNEPSYEKKHLLFKFAVMSRYGSTLQGGDNESDNILRLQKKVL
jgi:hypothetical protein